MRLMSVIDAMIHRQTRESASAEELKKLRTLAGVCTSILPSCIGVGLSVGRSEPISLLCCSLLFMAVASVLVRLRLTGQRRHSGTVLWVSILTLNVYSAMHQDALFAYPSPSLAVIVVLAVYLEGFGQGLVATALAILAMVPLYLMHSSGHTLPAFAAHNEPMMTMLVNAAFGLASVTVLIWVKHSSLERAFADLGAALAKVKESEALRERMEIDLRLSQKLEAVGRLASGIAHEINTPMQYVGDSIKFGREALDDLTTVFDAYQRLEEAVAACPEAKTALEDLADAKEVADYEYTVTELPSALARAFDGVGRVALIVRSMKEFAHPNQRSRTPADLNRAIRSTLTIAQSEYRHVADVEMVLSELPPVTCLLSEVNQVILNLVVNASHAIAEKNRGTPKRGTIKIESWLESEQAVIAVTDDGGGIPLELQPMIFSPFFTTKEVGRGTGQGLAIARAVIIKQHGGTLTFDSTPGVGTTFFIRLPVNITTDKLMAAA